MLTISRLASYAGVTVAAVRHYHRVGLLPEPERDPSGYRRYGADAVVRLIRIHALAAGGVPLAQVGELLDADAATFAARVEQIDARLRREIRSLQRTRERLSRLAAGDQLALPASVIGYLQRLRDLGVSDRYLERERDAWIVVAAQVPEQIDAMIAAKHDDLADPDIVRLYELVSGFDGYAPDDPRVVETADLLDRIGRAALATGRAETATLDEELGGLIDAGTAESSATADRLLSLLRERGWHGLVTTALRERPSPRP